MAEAKKAPNAMTADAPMESVVSEGQINLKSAIILIMI
jgi:hypothetical protein